MKRLILIAILAATAPAMALEEFYSITRSVRALGMGGAFYGMSDDQYALFYNPAGLSLYRMDSQLMLNIQLQTAPATLSALSAISRATSISTVVNTVAPYAGSPLYIGAGVMPFYVRKNFGIGFLIADAKMDFALLGRELDSDVDLTAISDSGVVVGYGTEVAPDLHVGASLKGLFRAGGRKVFTMLDIAQSNAFRIEPRELGGMGMGVDLDLGMIYELKDLAWGESNRLSFNFNNLLATKFTMARQFGPPPGLPRMFSLSYYTVFKGWNFIDNFHVVFDLSEFQLGGDNSDPDKGGRTGNFFKHVNFGVEMPMGAFAVRTGFHQGYWTAGVGVRTKAIQADLAYYTEEVSNQPGRLPSRRFALNIAIGGGSTSPPVSSDTWETPRADEAKEPLFEKTPDKTPPVELTPESETKIEPPPEAKPEPKVEEPKPKEREPSSIKKKPQKSKVKSK